MIKIIHLADIHLGMENYGTTDRKTGLNSRLLDFLRNLDYVVDYTLKNKVDFWLFAGDAFKTRDPSPTQQREFAKRIKKVAAAGIPVIIVLGNHDLPNASGKADTLEIYKTLAVDNVYISQKPELLNFKKTKSGWILDKNSKSKKTKSTFQIATLPWIIKSRLTTKKDYQHKTIDQVHDLMTVKISQIVKDLAKQVDTARPSALVAHATVAGAVFGAERKVYVGSDVILPLNIFKQPWHYVALGHLHKYQALLKKPPVVYAGSIDRVDFGEATEKKGFVVAEINNSTSQVKTSYKFIAVPARKFVAINIKINDNDRDPTAKICAAIAKHKIKDSVVKIMITVPETIVGFIKENEIRSSLQEAYYLAGIKKEIIKVERTSTAVRGIESLDPLAALQKYFSTRNKKAQKTKDLQGLARKIVKEVDEELR